MPKELTLEQALYKLEDMLTESFKPKGIAQKGLTGVQRDTMYVLVKHAQKEVKKLRGEKT